jgi:hypothetical protein
VYGRWCSKKAVVLSISACFSAGAAQAFKVDTSPEWDVNFDNSIQYTAGWRAQNMDPKIGNHLFMSQGDYKFPKKGDMVTNRVQDLIEFQGIYKQQAGFRVSASIWKDMAYNDDAKTNPNNPAFGALNAYPSGHYSDFTNRYFREGGELLDSFIFVNTVIGDTPVYAKAGRLTQYWGNAFFFGFSNIGYSQSPVDYIKGFSQPGSEVKELFLPRKQILLSAELTPELSVAGQYFFEHRPNRYPESGTYLGFSDILFDGNPGAGALAGYGITQNDGMVKPPSDNHDWGLKVSWSPKWAGGDMGFYYRQFDEVDPWLALVNPTTGHLQDTFAQKAKLIGFSYEKSFGLISTGFEVSQRRDTALNSATLVATNEGAKGTITNVIANTMVQLGKTPLWDTGILLAELSYTRLNSVTGNANLYNGVGTANCLKDGVPGTVGSWRDGCSTKNSLAFAMLFNPQWLQVFPGIDIELPISYTWGVHGNPAYRAGSFYAQGTNIYSIGVKATYQAKTSLTLQYNGYRWRPGGTADNGLGAGLPAYAGFGGNGAVALNDRGWFQVMLKSSF